MAMFPLRNKEEEAGQLLLTFPHSLINVSAGLYNALTHATLRAMGEHKTRLLTMGMLRAIEAECYKENHEATVTLIPRRGEKIPLYLIVLEVERPAGAWECAATVKVLFPITGHVEDQNHFMELLLAITRIRGQVEGGGLAVRAMLYGSDIPVERENPDDRHGKAWRYFMRKGETL